jgi:Kef-type K+ transport system membrane component KefB
VSTADVTADPAEKGKNLSGARLVIGYGVVAAFLAVALVVSLSLGHGRHAAPAIAGFYKSSDACLGDSFKLAQSGEFVDLSGGVSGKLRLKSGHLTGTVTCAAVTGSAATTSLAGTVGSSQATAKFDTPLPAPGVSTKEIPKRSSEETFGRLMLAIAAVLLAARLVGAGTNRLSQPRVMGEVLAGILLGPTLLGAVWPEAQAYLFPADIVPLLSAAAQIGLAFYLFLVGMEIDPQVVRQRLGQAAFLSNTSVAFPLALGFLVALPVYRLLAPHVRYAPFALFMGVAMSITAFPVLARILTERRMLRRPVGALAMTGAAVDDVTAWTLLALATAIAGTGKVGHAVQVVILATVFVLALLLIGRPVLARFSRAYDEVSQVSVVWLGGIFVCVLLAAYTAQSIGIASIFGAFMFGLIMPRRAGLTVAVGRTFETFVVLVLLPLFFVVTGLKTHVNALNRTELWVITLILIAVAIVGKFFGAAAAARWGGFSWRESAALGALMNTRGLTELIVLNIALDIGVISTLLFTMLVVMALVTTFMAGPLLRLIDPKGMFSEPIEEELRRARATEEQAVITVPTKAILLAPQDPDNLDALLTLAEPLAQAVPPRELIMVQVVAPERFVTGTMQDEAELNDLSAELAERRDRLIGRGIAARSVALTSILPGQDYVRLANEEGVDLIMLDGRRPLLGGGVPRGSVGQVLEQAECDVAVLVERQDTPTLDADHPVMTPFGGGDHDWAALELAAWISSSTGAPLKLLGAASGNGEGDASGVLQSASLVVQQLAGVTTESVLVDLQNGGILAATEGAGLLVVGLSDRWRSEGLGPVRSEIAKSAEAPTLFVRRGTRPGALAPRAGDVSRFAWSRA